MRLESLGVFTLCSALIALALFVILQNPRASVNRRFSLSAIAIAGWIFCISSALSAVQPHQTILLGRFGFAFASAIPFTLLWMFDSLAAPPPHRGPRRRVSIPGMFCVLFIGLSLSRFIVAGSSRGPSSANFVYGPAHRFFGLYFLSCFVFAVFTLARTIRSASGLRKLQLRYLLLGITLGGAGAITTNLLIPLISKTSHYSALGPYFSLLVVSFSAHAIIRYRLMDIRVVIKTGVVYSCALVASASIFVLVITVLRHLPAYDPNSISLGQALFVALALAIGFNPLKSLLHTSLNRYLYRETYDYPRTVREASRHLSALLDLNALLEYLQNSIANTFKAEGVAVYLRATGLPQYDHRSSTGGAQLPSSSTFPAIHDSSPLVALLRIQNRSVVREEAVRAIHDQMTIDAGRVLETLNGDIALPFADEGTLIGFILVGPKRSGDPYFAEDIELLDTLIGQASVATRNARLYQQIVLANEYVDHILATMDSGVIAIDLSGSISLFNRAAEGLTGLPVRDVLGRPYNALPAGLSAPLEETMTTRRPRSQFEISISSTNHLDLPLVCSTAPLRDTNGAIRGALVVFSNLSRLKELERENRRAERLASFGALASGVAHEIKNPLVAIRTFAELLPDRYTDVDFREDFSKVVVREIARIDDLVGRLRGIAATAPEPAGAVDIRHPLRDTLALLRAQLEQTNTTLDCDVSLEPLPVLVDEPQLKQLFLNLLLNATEAMGHGGHIHIRLNRRNMSGTQWVVASISDTGPGIPESDRPQIFDPFFTTKVKGSGLGLAICRGIADAHRGTIRAESIPGRRGTTFVVEFPLASVQSSLQTPSELAGTAIDI